MGGQIRITIKTMPIRNFDFPLFTESILLLVLSLNVLPDVKWSDKSSLALAD
jgi:hypothetical protein